MSDYRELFERLAKCNLPAGVDVSLHYDDVVDVSVAIEGKQSVISACDDGPQECRAALMLIVDALRAEGWRFSFEDNGGYSFSVACSNRGYMADGWGDDEVTALAECLIAALGVAE